MLTLDTATLLVEMMSKMGGRQPTLGQVLEFEPARAEKWFRKMERGVHPIDKTWHSPVYRPGNSPEERQSGWEDLIPEGF